MPKKRHTSTSSFLPAPAACRPIILFKDADLAAAARFLVRRAFINGGQYCTTLKRAYIHRDIYEPVKRLILENMAEIRVATPETRRPGSAPSGWRAPGRFWTGPWRP